MNFWDKALRDWDYRLDHWYEPRIVFQNDSTRVIRKIHDHRKANDPAHVRMSVVIEFRTKDAMGVEQWQTQSQIKIDSLLTNVAEQALYLLLHPTRHGIDS